MDRCGIDATVERGDDSAQVRMTNCPYSALAKENPQVCQAHFELVQEVLHRVDGPLEAQSIHPFAGEGQCTLDLRDVSETSERRSRTM